MQSAVPGVGDIPGEERIRLAPVGAVVVEHLAPREITRALAPARSPGWVVADAIRRIGNHQVGLRSVQHLCDIRRAGTVAAANPIVFQPPYVAAPSDRLIGDIRDAVRIGQTARSRTGHNAFELTRLEAGQAEIKTAELQISKFVTEQLKVPARPVAS